MECVKIRGRGCCNHLLADVTQQIVPADPHSTQCPLSVHYLHHCKQSLKMIF